MHHTFIRKLAEIYESDLKDEESTKEVLLKGIENCDDKASYT